MPERPWMTGPKELLLHAIDHLKEDTSFGNRIAFISTDNGIELLAHTFLNLPMRARGSSGPGPKDLEAARGSFPQLLDLLEKHASERLGDVDLAEVLPPDS
jgi:hypothetical protein